MFNIQVADTRWNSILHLFKCLFELRALINTILALLLTAAANTGEVLHVLPNLQ